MIFFAGIVTGQNEESIYFRSSTLMAFIGAITSVANIGLIVVLALSGEKIQNTALTIATEYKDASKRVEFATLFPLIAEELSEIIEKTSNTLKGDRNHIDTENALNFNKGLKSLSPDEKLVYDKIFQQYILKYDGFYSLFEGYEVLLSHLQNSKFGQFRDNIKHF